MNVVIIVVVVLLFALQAPPKRHSYRPFGTPGVIPLRRDPDE